MTVSEAKHSFFQKLSLWRENGASHLSITINGLLLFLAWVLFPLEREPWRSFCARLPHLYPQINFEAPCALDGLRFLIQSVFLSVAKFPKTSKTLVKRFQRVHLRVALFFRRISYFIGHYGAILLEGNQRGLESIDKHGSAIPRVVKLALLWILGALVVFLAVLCITQPFNIQGQVLFLSVMLVLALMLTQIKARLTLMLLFVISMVVSGRYLWWRCTSTVNTDSVIGIVFSLLLLLAEIYAFTVMLLGYFQVCWVLDRKPYPMPKDKTLWPHVDIFIPTYNEPFGSD